MLPFVLLNHDLVLCMSCGGHLQMVAKKSLDHVSITHTKTKLPNQVKYHVEKQGCVAGMVS